jgi:hypothetical protein
MTLLGKRELCLPLLLVFVFGNCYSYEKKGDAMMAIAIPDSVLCADSTLL